MNIDNDFNFKEDDYGWVATLTESSGLFLGKQIKIDLSTRVIPTKPEILPAPHTYQKELLKKILPELPTILQKCEKEFLGYYEGRCTKEFLEEQIDFPKISLSVDQDEDYNPVPMDGEEWSFVIEFKESGVGHHIDYIGLEFQEIWAGG